jgi:hypothetical protein
MKGKDKLIPGEDGFGVLDELNLSAERRM